MLVSQIHHSITFMFFLVVTTSLIEFIFIIFIVPNLFLPYSH